MALGLGFLGRGRKRRLLMVVVMHVAAAAAGGAAAGALLGMIGDSLALADVRAPVIFGATVVAIVSVVSGPARLGVRRQVPRSLGRTVPVGVAYVLWGAQLGFGLSTLIPYSVFLVVAGAQLTSGVLLGSISGALYGGMRQSVSVVPVIRRWTPERTMELLPRFDRLAARANLVAVLVGGSLLVMAGH